MPLTQFKIVNATAKEKSTKLSDGQGLHLLVQPSGTKLWRAGSGKLNSMDKWNFCLSAA